MVDINIDPNLLNVDFIYSWVVSWHGFFSFVAVASAVILVGRWANLVVVDDKAEKDKTEKGEATKDTVEEDRKKRLDSDIIYSVAIWAIIGGIVGARLVHVIDNWSEIYAQRPVQILYVASGGIALWGGILGGFAGGAIYALIAKHPVGAIADLTAPAMLYAQTIGRIGDIVNGEHCAKAADFFAFRWTHNETTARLCTNGFSNGAHAVIIYEMAWNMIALAVIWKLRGRLKPDGMLFALYLAFYSVGRFLVSFLREDKVWALGMQEAHYIALLVLAVTVPLLAFKARFKGSAEPVAVVVQRGTRAQRRRRARR